ncbi:MAG: response regulator transcription factor [Calditrichaeota bacterium]|nr:response regulator transcription factor [Calditrichota bacterium]
MEDNPYIRSGWRALLEGIPDLLVLGAYESVEAAFDGEDFFESEVVVMDIGLPGMKGTEAVRHILQQNPAVHVLICSVHEDDDNIFEAICNGAVGYLLKSTSPEDFVRAIRIAVADGSPMSPSIARKVLRSFRKFPVESPDAETDRLNEREQAVLGELARGKSYREIASDLNLSLDGVRYHIRAIYRKLQVHGAPEAIAVALKKRLIR